MNNANAVVAREDTETQQLRARSIITARRLVAWFAAGALYAGVAGCGGAAAPGSPAIETVTNPDVPITEARTVALVPRAGVPGFERIELPLALREAAEQAAAYTLERLGWTVTTPDQADIVIQGAVGRRLSQAPSIATPPAHFDFGSAVTSQEVSYTEATLVLDAFIRADRTHIWHAHALGAVSGEPTPERFAAIVERLLVNFPRVYVPPVSQPPEDQANPAAAAAD